MKIAVVILNYNGKKHLEKYLPSVIEYSNDATIYIADNCSTDNSVDFIQKNYPNLPIIINDDNGGFAKGYNDALKKVKADYYILLNSDIEVTPNWITPVMKIFDKDDKIVAAQPKILAFLNKEKFEHAGAAGGFMDRNGYPFCRGRIFNFTEIDENQYDDDSEIFWATGACMFIKANIFHEAGGFDEDYFAHMEEIDLCWRLKNKGYKIWYVPSAKIYHLGGGTLSYESPRKVYLNFRNSLYTVFKNQRKFMLWIIFKRMVLDGVAGVKFLTEGNFKSTIKIIQAHFSFYVSIPKLIKKRRKIKKEKFNSIGIYKKSIVFDFFVKKKQKYLDLNQDKFF